MPPPGLGDQSNIEKLGDEARTLYVLMSKEIQAIKEKLDAIASPRSEATVENSSSRKSRKTRIKTYVAKEKQLETAKQRSEHLVRHTCFAICLLSH